jgi:chromosome segregation ATPase
VQQARQADQLDALQKAIEAKEATWRRLNGGHGKFSEIKARFDRELGQLQAQRDELQAERAKLLKVHAHLLLLDLPFAAVSEHRLRSRV